MIEKPSTISGKDSGMEFVDTQEIILALKAVKKSEHVSIKRIMEMLDANGQSLSETTLRRIFAENSENEDSFSYDRTLKPVAEVLLSEDAGTATQSQAKTDLLMAVLREKNGVIERQKDRIEMLTDQIDKMRDQLATIRQSYDTRLAFLRDLIELKDRRMDEKDAIIARLMDKIL